MIWVQVWCENRKFQVNAMFTTLYCHFHIMLCLLFCAKENITLYRFRNKLNSWWYYCWHFFLLVNMYTIARRIRIIHYIILYILITTTMGFSKRAISSDWVVYFSRRCHIILLLSSCVYNNTPVYWRISKRSAQMV